jgi:hypothetical protein
MIKNITTVLTSPLNYKYKCVFIYNYIINTNNKINGTFYIGNPKTTVDEACITISVFYPSTDSLMNSSIASLILVKYYETRSENKKLSQGEGTVDMINTSMSFVKQICPFIKEFKLNDASTKKCNNGSVISLPYFYITQKHKTWYEGRFKAYLHEPFYTNYKNDLSKIMNSILPSFEIFKINHILNTPDTIINELKTIYNEGDTVDIFFQNLYSKYDRSMGCIILQPWIDKFMSNVGLQKYITSQEWFISSDTIPIYSFKYNNKNTYKINNFNNTRKRYPWNN